MKGEASSAAELSVGGAPQKSQENQGRPDFEEWEKEKAKKGRGPGGMYLTRPFCAEKNGPWGKSNARGPWGPLLTSESREEEGELWGFRSGGRLWRLLTGICSERQELVQALL